MSKITLVSLNFKTVIGRGEIAFAIVDTDAWKQLSTKEQENLLLSHLRQARPGAELTSWLPWQQMVPGIYMEP